MNKKEIYKKEIYKKAVQQQNPDWHELFALIKENRLNIRRLNLIAFLLLTMIFTLTILNFS